MGFGEGRQFAGLVQKRQSCGFPPKGLAVRPAAVEVSGLFSFDIQMPIYSELRFWGKGIKRLWADGECRFCSTPVLLSNDRQWDGAGINPFGCRIVGGDGRMLLELRGSKE